MDTKPNLLSARPRMGAPNEANGEMRLVLTLTPGQQRNLLAFLQRAQLSGKEVPAFNEVFALIQRAQAAPVSEPNLKSETRNPKPENTES